MKTINNMKHALSIILIFTLMLGFSISAFAGSGKLKIKTNAVCDHCKQRIEGALNNLEGVEKVYLNLNNKTVQVKYDDELLTEADIKKAITDAGYSADEMKANKAAYDKLPGCCKSKSSCTKDKSSGCSGHSKTEEL